MSLSIPFPFWVAAEQKGGQGWGLYIAGFPLLGRDSSPPLTFVSDVAIFVLKRDFILQLTNLLFFMLQLQMNRLEQLCMQYLESCIGVRNVLVALQNAAKLGLDFVRVSRLCFMMWFPC